MEMSDIALADGGGGGGVAAEAVREEKGQNNDDGSSSSSLPLSIVKNKTTTTLTIRDAVSVPSDEDDYCDGDDDDEYSEEEDEEEGRSLLFSHHNNKQNIDVKDSDDDYEQIQRYRIDYRKQRQKQKQRQNSESSIKSLISNILQYHLLGSDGPWMKKTDYSNNNKQSQQPPLQSQQIVLDSTTIKFLKFIVVSMLCLLFVHTYVRVVDDKLDETYGITQMILYDSNLIILDLIVFFVIGRLYEHDRSVDTLSWIGPVLCSAIFQSYGATHFTSVSYSVTIQQIICDWTWQMWTLVLLSILFILMVVIRHITESYKRGIGVRKLIEVLSTITIFIVPYLFTPTFFHLHHWYYSWLIGMNCNLNTWWSKLCMCFFFGLYVNGVAIFGRDPIMTCAITFYQSSNQNCPYYPEDGGGWDNYTFEDLIQDTVTAANDVVDGDENGAGCVAR